MEDWNAENSQQLTSLLQKPRNFCWKLKCDWKLKDIQKFSPTFTCHHQQLSFHLFYIHKFQISHQSGISVAAVVTSLSLWRCWVAQKFSNLMNSLLLFHCHKSLSWLPCLSSFPFIIVKNRQEDSRAEEEAKKFFLIDEVNRIKLNEDY